jgi:hypothetical protein
MKVSDLPTITPLHNLSAKTRAEMEAGAGRVRSATAWEKADGAEKMWHERFPKCPFHARVSPIDHSAVELMLSTRLQAAGVEDVAFDDEPALTYPSPELVAKMMLVCG